MEIFLTSITVQHVQMLSLKKVKVVMMEIVPMVMAVMRIVHLSHNTILCVVITMLNFPSPMEEFGEVVLFQRSIVGEDMVSKKQGIMYK